MRDAVFALTMAGLLAISLAKPFAGVLVWSWISFMNPHQIIWGFAQGYSWGMMAFIATIVGCVVAGEPRRPAVNAVTVLLFLFMICITITSATALAAPTAVWQKWDQTMKVLAGLLLTAALLTDRWRVHALVWLMVIAVGYFGVRGGIFTLVTGGAFMVLGPPASIIGDRNHIAVALLITIPLINYLRLQSRHRVVRIGLAAAMLLSLIAAVGSQSRGALVALVATAAFLGLRSQQKVSFGIVAAICVAGVIAFMPDSWRERMDTIETFQSDASAMGRVEIWLASWKLAVDRPLVGGGFFSMYTQAVVDTVSPGTTARAAHSIWMEVLGEHGFPAFAVWLGVILAGVYYSWRILRLTKGREDLKWASDLARMSQVSIVAYVVGGSLLSLGYWDFFWALMVVVAATHTLVRRAIAEEALPGPALAGSGRVGRPASWRSARATATPRRI